MTDRPGLLLDGCLPRYHYVTGASLDVRGGDAVAAKPRGQPTAPRNLR